MEQWPEPGREGKQYPHHLVHAGAAPYPGALLVQSEGAIGSFDGIRNQSGADASYAGGAGGDVGIRFQGSVELESIVKVSQGSSRS